jgi:hypothetical protein
VISLGPMVYLDSKEKGDNSMPLNRLSCPGVRGEEPAGPHDTAKAGLPVAQSPDGAICHPSERRL